MSIGTEAQVPLLGKTRLMSHQTMVATVTLVDGVFVAEHTACAVATEAERSIVETHFPPAFVEHLPRKRYPLVVYRDGLGWRMDADLQPQYLGYDPALSPEGPPHDVAHPSVRDTDEDGKPGFTALASAPLFGEVEIWLVQVAHTELHGRLEPSGRIVGQAPMVRLDQWVVGASNRLFHRNPPVRPRPEVSTFVMDRVAAGSSCAAVLALKD